MRASFKGSPSASHDPSLAHIALFVTSVHTTSYPRLLFNIRLGGDSWSVSCVERVFLQARPTTMLLSLGKKRILMVLSKSWILYLSSSAVLIAGTKTTRNTCPRKCVTKRESHNWICQEVPKSNRYAVKVGSYHASMRAFL